MKIGFIPPVSMPALILLPMSFLLIVFDEMEGVVMFLEGSILYFV